MSPEGCSRWRGYCTTRTRRDRPPPRPEQVVENGRAADVRRGDDLVQRIDEILDPVVEGDPGLIDVVRE
jgi:hypothetical protein